MILLEIEVSNQALAVKFPCAVETNTQNTVGVCMATDAQWGRRVRFMIGHTAKYSLALTFRTLPVWLQFFLVKYLPLAFLGVQRWTTTSPFRKTRPYWWTVWMHAVLVKLSLCLDFLKHMLICSVVPSFSSPWVPSKMYKHKNLQLGNLGEYLGDYFIRSPLRGLKVQTLMTFLRNICD